MEQPIENTLIPDTVNEVLLLNRIKELHIEMFQQRTKIFSPYSDYKNTDIILASPAPVRLNLAASVESEDLEYPKGIKIRAQTRAGKFSLGYHYYMVERDIEQIGYVSSGQLLSELHKLMLYKLAAAIETERKKP